MALVVAVDVGSTSARAGLFDAGGQCLGRMVAPFTTARPLPHHAEHAFDDIWQAVCTAVRVVAGSSAHEVSGLAFDATCSLAVFDKAGDAVTVSTTGDDRWNVVMWADHRATAEAAAISATGHRSLRHVGGVMSPEMQLPKLLWLKRNLPASWARIGLAFDLADALTWRATARIAMSACTVTCKWAFLNHETPGWQQDLMDRIGLEDFRARTGLPDRPQPIGAPSGPLTTQAATELGLSTGCVVGVGLIDAHAGGLALLGALEGEELNQGLALIAGTSTCHMAASPEARYVPGVWGPYWGAMRPGTWLNEGGQSATGALLDHILNWHAEGRALGATGHQVVTERVMTLLDVHGPGMADGIRVLPDFSGNRSPLADPAARGVIEGLTLDSSFDSLARLYYAAAVGIAFGTRHIIDALRPAGYAIQTLHLAGGHAASPLLPQLYADATGCNVVLCDEADSILSGTASVAATAAVLHPSLAVSVGESAGATRRSTPRPEQSRYLEQEYAHFLRMTGIVHRTS